MIKLTVLLGPLFSGVASAGQNGQRPPNNFEFARYFLKIKTTHHYISKLYI
jgi:hypothetical protein